MNLGNKFIAVTVLKSSTQSSLVLEHDRKQMISINSIEVIDPPNSVWRIDGVEVGKTRLIINVGGRTNKIFVKESIEEIMSQIEG